MFIKNPYLLILVFSLGLVCHELLAEEEAPKINWLTDIPTAAKQAAQEGKPILARFGAEWCTYCKKMDHYAFDDDKICAMINDHFVPLYIDADLHPSMLAKMGVKSLPSFVVLSPLMNVVDRSSGYKKEKEFIAFIEPHCKLHAIAVQNIQNNAPAVQQVEAHRFTIKSELDQPVNMQTSSQPVFQPSTQSPPPSNLQPSSIPVPKPSLNFNTVYNEPAPSAGIAKRPDANTFQQLPEYPPVNSFSPPAFDNHLHNYNPNLPANTQVSQQTPPQNQQMSQYGNQQFNQPSGPPRQHQIFENPWAKAEVDPKAKISIATLPPPLELQDNQSPQNSRNQPVQTPAVAPKVNQLEDAPLWSKPEQVAQTNVNQQKIESQGSFEKPVVQDKLPPNYNPFKDPAFAAKPEDNKSENKQVTPPWEQPATSQTNNPEKKKINAYWELSKNGNQQTPVSTEEKSENQEMSKGLPEGHVPVKSLPPLSVDNTTKLTDTKNPFGPLEATEKAQPTLKQEVAATNAPWELPTPAAVKTPDAVKQDKPEESAFKQPWNVEQPAERKKIVLNKEPDYSLQEKSAVEKTAAIPVSRTDAVPAENNQAPLVVEKPRELPLAFGGTCLVSILEDSKLITGTQQYKTVYQGYTLYFANSKYQDLFLANPARYWPANNGVCPVYATDKQMVLLGQPAFAVRYMGKIHFCADREAALAFLNDPKKYNDYLRK